MAITAHNNIIIIQGPTASGKTSLSVSVAKILQNVVVSEIVSADSRQVYKYMDIGTAKPTKEEMQSIPHHLVDILDPSDVYSAGRFRTDATTIINLLHKEKKLPIVVGGTGLYISALCEGLFDDGSYDYSEIRKALTERLSIVGIDELYKELTVIDNISAEKYKDKNPRRVLRALEYYHFHRKPLSSAHIEYQTNNDFNTLYFAIEMERSDLYDRINTRCTHMWDLGLLHETVKLLDMGFSTELNSLNTVGYKEAIKVINHELSIDEAKGLMAQNTRRYAKRQLTWLRNRQINYIWLKGTQDDMVETIMTTLQEKYVM